MMALSSTPRISKRQVRPALNAFRITKASKLNQQAQISKQKYDAIEELISEETTPIPQSPPKTQDLNSKKRRHDAAEPDNATEEGATRPQKSLRKARPTTVLPTPPQSPTTPHILPDSLEELLSLHNTFVQALAVHFAHNGIRNAVSLRELMPAMTRLWKRRTVCLQDVQRMLALCELPALGTGQEIDHHTGPFRLITTGIGSNQRTNVEYASNNLSMTFPDKELQAQYDQQIWNIYQKAQSDGSDYQYIFEPLVYFPRLRCELGSQTQARQEKINSIRDQIISKPRSGLEASQQSDPDFSRLNITDPLDQKPPVSREDKLKSRTLGLFDRLKAKQLANSNSASAPSNAEMLRRRALHRVPDIIDVLRLKQSQKLNLLLRSDLHGSPSGTRGSKMKVSFSFDQLVQEIKDSGRVPVSTEEIKECINILGKQIPDTWCTVYTGNGLSCVTLQGEGWRKEEVAEWSKREVATMDRKR